jgi:hypothetical protein
MNLKKSSGSGNKPRRILNLLSWNKRHKLLIPAASTAAPR